MGRIYTCRRCKAWTGEKYYARYMYSEDLCRLCHDYLEMWAPNVVMPED